MATKPTALLVGGLLEGVTRVLLHYLCDHDLVSHVRIVDKALIVPSASVYLTYLDVKTRDLLKSDPRVEYRQANLGRDEACQAAFEPPAGSGGPAYDWVFDNSGDASMGADSHEVHCQLVAKFAASLARAALRNGGVKAYVRVLLPAFVAKNGPSGTPILEDDPNVLPWSRAALWQFEACRALANFPDLPLVIARRAAPVGPHVLTDFTGRLLIAQLYKHMGQKFELLWAADQRRHTVHGSDLASALVTLAQWMVPLGRARADELAGSPLSPCRPLPSWVNFGSQGSPAHAYDETEVSGLAPRTATLRAPLFNVVDDGDTRAGPYNALIASVIGAEYGRVSLLVSTYARSHMRETIEEANEIHSEAWQEMIAHSQPPVVNTPLSPALPFDLMADRHCSLDGAKIRRIVGWKPVHPQVTAEIVREALETWQREPGAWPCSPTRKELEAAGKLA